MKFKTPWNEVPSRNRGESNYGPSMTIPDQTMSVAEIMQRYARGLPIEGAKVPLYDEDNDMPDINRLDLAERQEMIQQAKDELADIKERHKKKPLEKSPEDIQDEMQSERQ